MAFLSSSRDYSIGSLSFIPNLGVNNFSSNIFRFVVFLWDRIMIMSSRMLISMLQDRSKNSLTELHVIVSNIANTIIISYNNYLIKYPPIVVNHCT